MTSNVGNSKVATKRLKLLAGGRKAILAPVILIGGDDNRLSFSRIDNIITVSYTHLTLPTNREV